VAARDRDGSRIHKHSTAEGGAPSGDQGMISGKIKQQFEIEERAKHEGDTRVKEGLNRRHVPNRASLSVVEDRCPVHADVKLYLSQVNLTCRLKTRLYRLFHSGRALWQSFRKELQF